VDLKIRPALPRDKRAVFEVVRTIWRAYFERSLRR